MKETKEEIQQIVARRILQDGPIKLALFSPQAIQKRAGLAKFRTSLWSNSQEGDGRKVWIKRRMLASQTYILYITLLAIVYQ